MPEMIAALPGSLDHPGDQNLWCKVARAIGGELNDTNDVSKRYYRRICKEVAIGEAHPKRLLAAYQAGVRAKHDGFDRPGSQVVSEWNEWPLQEELRQEKQAADANRKLVAEENARRKQQVEAEEKARQEAEDKALLANFQAIWALVPGPEREAIDAEARRSRVNQILFGSIQDRDNNVLCAQARLKVIQARAASSRVAESTTGALCQEALA